MINTKAKQQTLTRSYATPPYSESDRSLIVPILSPDADFTVITPKLWELAKATGSRLRLIGLCNSLTQEPGIRRALVTMAAMLRSTDVSVDVEVLVGKNWVDKLRSRLHRGDMVVCWDAQPADLLGRPLRQVLQSNPDVPLYIIPDISSQSEFRTPWTTQVAALMGFIAIIIGFLFLQIKIYQPSNSWTTVLELLSTTLEFWLLLLWNNWFK